MVTAKMRYTDPLSGQRLLAGTIPAIASKEAKDKAFEQVKQSLEAVYGKKTAETLSWDKGDY